MLDAEFFIQNTQDFHKALREAELVSEKYFVEFQTRAGILKISFWRWPEPPGDAIWIELDSFYTILETISMELAHTSYEWHELHPPHPMLLARTGGYVEEFRVLQRFPPRLFKWRQDMNMRFQNTQGSGCKLAGPVHRRAVQFLCEVAQREAAINSNGFLFRGPPLVLE